MVQLFAGKNSLAVPPKVKPKMTIGPSHSTPRMYAKELKARIQTNTCMPMLVAAFLAITKYPSVDECTNQMWSVHTMVYYLADHRNDLGLDSGMGVMGGREWSWRVT